MPESDIRPVKIAYRIDEAIRASGLGKTFLYEHMAKGTLKSVKIGGRRLILHDELVDFLLRESRAEFSAPLQKGASKLKLGRKAGGPSAAAGPGQ